MATRRRPLRQIVRQTSCTVATRAMTEPTQEASQCSLHFLLFPRRSLSYSPAKNHRRQLTAPRESPLRGGHFRPIIDRRWPTADEYPTLNRTARRRWAQESTEILWSLIASTNQENSNADRMALEQTTTCSRRTAGKDKCRACDPVLPPTPAWLRRSGAFSERLALPGKAIAKSPVQGALGRHQKVQACPSVTLRS